MKLTFLGTRGEIDMRTARHRRHSSLIVAHGGTRVMIDCGLDWLKALHELKPRPHAIVLTHAHPDHAWGLENGAPCPIFATRKTWTALRDFPIAGRRTVCHRRKFAIGGIQFEAFSVEHSLLAPAVGYRIRAGSAEIFYVPDVVFIRERRAALSGVKLYIGDGATIRRPLIRRRGQRLIGHAPISAQLTWCRKFNASRAIITHCGSGIVSDEAHAVAEVTALGEERGISVEIAYDGMKRRI